MCSQNWDFFKPVSDVIIGLYFGMMSLMQYIRAAVLCHWLWAQVLCVCLCVH